MDLDRQSDGWVGGGRKTINKWPVLDKNIVVSLGKTTSGEEQIEIHDRIQ